MLYVFKRKVIVCISIFLLITLNAAYSNPGGTPEESLNNLINLFKSYHRGNNGTELTSAQDKENEITGSKIEEIFDYDALIHGALRDQWNSMTKKQQTDFYNMFKELVEVVAYPQGSYFYNNSQNKFDKTIYENGKAIINSNNYNTDKDIEVTIGYIFEKKNDHWVMVDITMNKHSLLDAYAMQINRIVSKNGLEGLMERLKEKHQEALKKIGK